MCKIAHNRMTAYCKNIIYTLSKFVYAHKMDTRFWGPSGWRLLHLITYTYDPITQRHTMRKFLETIPYILPCKFCRASLTDYYKLHPFSPALESRAKLTRWIYTIHNDVNAKLRSQGLLTAADPSFKQVNDTYKTWINTSVPTERLQTFWDFLFSVAYGHPYDTARTAKPMPKCPPYATTCKSKATRNKWNTLGPSDRFHFYKQFWQTLPDILEPALRIQWMRALKTNSPSLACRRSIIAWLWRMRCALDTDYKDPYTEICSKVASYSSDCSSSVRAKTCRKKRR